MAYHCTPTQLDGVLVLEPQVFGDDRGFFFESFNARDFEKATGISTPFVQDNHSRSARGVLRGLHFQNPKPQGKLVRVSHGEVFDVALDIRPNSSTFGEWFGIHLSADNKKQLWIAPGFAHGFLVVSDHAEFLYKTTDYWHPEFEQSVRWDDPDLNIDWPLPNDKLSEKLQPSLAKKDSMAKSWREIEKDLQAMKRINDD